MQVDWSLVAEEQNISNAHAARMRWHRIKQQKGRETGILQSSPRRPKDEGQGSSGKTRKGKEKEGLEERSPLTKKRSHDDMDSEIGKDIDMPPVKKPKIKSYEAEASSALGENAIDPALMARVKQEAHDVEDRATRIKPDPEELPLIKVEEANSEIQGKVTIKIEED